MSDESPGLSSSIQLVPAERKLNLNLFELNLNWKTV